MTIVSSVIVCFKALGIAVLDPSGSRVSPQIPPVEPRGRDPVIGDVEHGPDNRCPGQTRHPPEPWQARPDQQERVNTGTQPAPVPDMEAAGRGVRA